MSITLYYEVACDHCGCAIGHYTFRPASNAKDDGAVIKKGKHFCDESCERNYNNSPSRA